MFCLLLVCSVCSGDCIFIQTQKGTIEATGTVMYLLDFRNADLSLRPGLAESWRRIDARTLELKLRERVRFHNGDVMTAEDVAFSFGPERMWTGSSVDTRGMYVSTATGANSKVPPPEAPGMAMLPATEGSQFPASS